MPERAKQTTPAAVLSWLLLAVLALILLTPNVASAQDETEAPAEHSATEESEGPSSEQLAEVELLREGSAVYAQICSSCHQPGGIGLEGQYPPLIDNSNVDDAAYIDEVIENGLSGEITVAGVAYDGVMPSFSTLSDDDTDAVIAFIQNDFVAPAAAVVDPIGPVAGTELPGLSRFGALVTWVLALGVAGLVFAPRIVGRVDRLQMPWLDAWLKTAVIVSSAILLTIVIPDWVIKNGAVTDLSRFAQDLIGVGLWAGGVAVMIWGLWYAHRDSRI